MIKHPGFYVWNPLSSYPRYTHRTLKAASDEAKRLAKDHPGQAFFVMTPVAVASADVTPVSFGLVSQEMPDDQDLDDLIPF